MRVLLFSLLLAFSCSIVWSQENLYKVVLDKTINGSYEVSPALPEDGKVKAGTELTITAKPAKGYITDCTYYATPGSWGLMYFESTDSKRKVTVDKRMHIGASFIAKSKVENINVTQDVVYATPGVKPLKYDVYSPDNARNLPCVVIIHGGGWSSNTEDIMRGLAHELVKDGKYVVFSIDYRWIGQLDGDKQNTEMYQIIEDVFGAIAHIIEHAAEYGGDPSKIAITGDSAGGHLAASVTNMCSHIGDKGFGEVPGVYELKPTYIPENKNISEVKEEIINAIKAVAPSYGVLTDAPLKGFLKRDDEFVKAVSPINYIPKADKRSVPQFLLRGTGDVLIRDNDIIEYVHALVKAGQRVEYVQVGGAGHAFFDWKPNKSTKQAFAKYGVYYASRMQAFFDSVFNEN